ncbi:MAG: MOSC domain-containing protein [Bacillota bacterium]
MQVTELNIYPIKSARAQSLPQMKITAQGPEGDREWMLIDENGKFLSQRTLPKLATIEVFHEAAALTVGIQKMFFKVSKNNSFARKVKVQIWNDTFEAALEPNLYSQALSQYLGVNCRLVRYAPYSQRRVLSRVMEWKPEVRFSDCRPVLLMNTRSLEDLNSKLSTPVPMSRFRPNIVVDGGEAFADESWKRIKIGDVIFSQPKKSSCCGIINIDQQSGEPQGAEPFNTLASYRKDHTGVHLGTLWIPENEGILKMGDPLEIL